jgi:hypothetical protein
VHPASDTMRGKACKAMAAAQQDEAKRRDHARNGTPGYSFLPFSLKTYGCLGKEADQLMRDLADGAVSTGLCERTDYLHWIRKEISLGLIRGNARIIKMFVGCLARGIGENFQQGPNMPALDV